MKAIITGDIIRSRTSDTSEWLPKLKSVLRNYGSDPHTWQIYRGDSFQIRMSPEQALTAAIILKATIRTIPDLDVRIGIGIGPELYEGDKVTESNGAAYVHSGEAYEALRKNTLMIRSGDEQVNERLNLMFSLATLTFDRWSVIEAEAVKVRLENPDSNQTELARTLGKSQGAVSQALRRAGNHELLRLIGYYKSEIRRITS